MRKIIATLLCIAITLGVVACGTEGEKKTENKKEEVVKEETTLMKEYDIVYDLDAIPESFWEAYDYGYKDIDLTNKDVYLSRLENKIGPRYGKLAMPLDEFVQYTVIDNVTYKMTANKGGWLHAQNITPIGDGSFDDAVDYYYITTDLDLHYVCMMLEEGKYPVSKESDGYVGTFNGWDMIVDTADNTKIGGKLYQKINEELYLSISAGRIENLTDEQYKTFYKTLAESFTFEGVDESINFEQIVLSEKYTKIKLGEDVTLDFSNCHISSWLVSEGAQEYNLINVVEKEKDVYYKIVEYPEDIDVDDLQTEYAETYGLEEYTYGDFLMYLGRCKEIAIGDKIITEGGTINIFVFEQDGIAYSIERIAKTDLVTLKDVKNELDNISFLSGKVFEK